MLKRLKLLLLLGSIPLLFSACVGSMMSKEPQKEYKEQLYVDARLNFALNHPLTWKRQQLPVSSPEYRADSVVWHIFDPQEKGAAFGDMLIRCTPTDPEVTLPDLLQSYLAELPEMKTGKTESFPHPVGNALKILGQAQDRSRLTIALKGQRQDFIISFDVPSSRFDELQPVFLDIIDSFIEVVHPELGSY